MEPRGVIQPQKSKEGKSSKPKAQEKLHYLKPQEAPAGIIHASDLSQQRQACQGSDRTGILGLRRHDALFFHVLLAPSALESPHRFRPAYSAVKAGTCPRSPKPRHSLGRVKCPGQGRMTRLWMVLNWTFY